MPGLLRVTGALCVSSPAVVPSLVETTHHVEPERAFEFWRCTALARFGDIARPRPPNERFSAKRLTVARRTGS